MLKEILIIGSGGREDALAWKISQSPNVGNIYMAPGNGGSSRFGENVNIPIENIEGLADFAEKKRIDLTVVGPDDVLADGVVDVFQERGLPIFGPTQEAAKMESSKKFAKEIMEKSGVPTASYKVFSEYREALDYVGDHQLPLVIKADGLALGKGVYICRTMDEAKKALGEIMVNRVHKKAGDKVIVEEFLEGNEVSIHVLSDGKNSVMFPTSKDHKTIGENNKGENTGGMGTIAPVPGFSEEMLSDVDKKIVKPILETLREKGNPFVGCLYPGLIMTKSGPKVLEFNARFGDPETQSYMRLLNTDLVDVLGACINGNLDKIKIEWVKKYAACVILSSGGYPGEYKKGVPIFGVDEAQKLEDIVVFHAGTKMVDNRLVTNGGRVLGVTATGESLRIALDKVYEAIKFIKFDGMYCRKDIGN